MSSTRAGVLVAALVAAATLEADRLRIGPAEDPALAALSRDLGSGARTAFESDWAAEEPGAWEWGRLQALPAIGPVRARQIVAARQAGTFGGRPAPAAWDELAGIGPRTVERIRDSLKASGGGAYTGGPATQAQDTLPTVRTFGPPAAGLPPGGPAGAPTDPPPTQPSEHRPP